MNLNLNISTPNNDKPKKMNTVPGQLTWDVLYSYIVSRGLGETITKQIVKDLKKTPPTAYPHVISHFNKYILRAQELVKESEQRETERIEANEPKKEEFTFGQEKIEETKAEEMPNIT